MHRKTAGYSPEQNGAAERLNLNLEQRSKALPADSGLGPEWWAEAMVTANHAELGSGEGAREDSVGDVLWGRSPTLATYGYLGRGHTSTAQGQPEEDGTGE